MTAETWLWILCYIGLDTKNMYMGFESNKSIDQTAQPRSLISTFVNLVYERIMYKLATSDLLNLVISVAE